MVNADGLTVDPVCAGPRTDEARGGGGVVGVLINPGTEDGRGIGGNCEAAAETSGSLISASGGCDDGVFDPAINRLKNI